MSTSILYHGFGIQGDRYKHTFYQQGAIVFSIEKDPLSLRCSCCQTPQVSIRGKVLRWYHTVPIGKKIYCLAHPSCSVQEWRYRPAKIGACKDFCVNGFIFPFNKKEFYHRAR